MENYSVQQLTFTYPGQDDPALENVSLTISQGEFITLCGRSGCGKSTLLRHLKSCFTPCGRTQGRILFENRPLNEVDQREQSQRIGFVLQNPESQIVTDKVWHELAFGLESLGYGTSEIRTRVAEIASFFGIQNWFHHTTAQLSGGQKQLLNLAAIMVMQPDILILDEPTSQLDPIAAQDFLEMLTKINRDLGTTILLAEHHLEEAFPLSDRVIVMRQGKIIANDSPYKVGEQLKREQNEMFEALPVPMRIYAKVPNQLACPITVREGRKWLEQMDDLRQLIKSQTASDQEKIDEQKELPFIELRENWFRYSVKEPDVIKNLSVKIKQGKWLAVVGGNGTGKSTMLSIIGGLIQPYRGQILLKGKQVKTTDKAYKKLIGVLPQNPQTLFVKNTVLQELKDMFSDKKLTAEDKQLLDKIIQLCELEKVLNQHPYDLSGGEQQRAALAKVLLLQPQILLLDEPTKGMDTYYKGKLAQQLKRMQQEIGMTIVMVSHDIEFCAQYADECAMFFDGSVVSQGTPRKVFAGKSFYTTTANRMAREKLPDAILPEDIIRACGGQSLEACKTAQVPAWKLIKDEKTAEQMEHSKKEAVLQIEHDDRENNKPTKRGSKSNWLAILMVLCIMPLTIWAGIAFWGDRKYYFISLLILLEMFIPFLYQFEDRRPQARELVVISVLCAIGVAGRTAFFMIPQFKPVAAIVIISAVCLGSETGFLIGAVTAFVSNIFFGQGPWTPWQMFGFGVIGFLAGILFKKKWLKKSRLSLCLYGGLATFLLYGGIMNTATVIIWQEKPNLNMFISAYLAGIPFDLIHSVSTVVFLLLLAKPMIEKIERVKTKYELIQATDQ